MRVPGANTSNGYIGKHHTCRLVTDKRAEPLRRFRRRHGPRSFTCRRTVLLAGLLVRPESPCEFLRLKPESAGRETPDDHPATGCAWIRSGERDVHQARPSPSHASLNSSFLAVADHDEGGRQRARPAFPTGFLRGHVGFTNDLDQIPRAVVRTKPKRRSQDLQPSRTRPPPRGSKRWLARRLNSLASPTSVPSRSTFRSSRLP